MNEDEQKPIQFLQPRNCLHLWPPKAIDTESKYRAINGSIGWKVKSWVPLLFSLLFAVDCDDGWWMVVVEQWNKVICTRIRVRCEKRGNPNERPLVLFGSTKDLFTKDPGVLVNKQKTRSDRLRHIIHPTRLNCGGGVNEWIVVC